jgi:TolB-like protein
MMHSDEITFGRFRLDLRRRELSREGAPVRLHPRAIDIVCELAVAKGEVVSKDALMSRLWPGRIVEEGNLHVHVSALRKALDEHGEGHSYIVTVPGRGYRLAGLTGASARLAEDSSPPHLPLPDKPSIAVMPFANLSGDPEQEYFADGMVEEIITALSRTHWLFVIARNSSFIYKGRTVDVKQVGRELGVRYLLEGGVRKAANRVRVTAQLIDVSTAAHLWADRFEEALEDIFDLQDQVASSVVGALARRLEQAEIERVKRKPTESFDAYDYFLKGMASFYQRSKEANSEALRLFSKAIELDADFASAYGMAAWCYVWRKINGWMIDYVGEIAQATRLARRAVELGRDDAIALARGGHALGFLVGDLDSSAAFLDRALMLNPNLMTGWYLSGWIRAYRGETDVAIEHLERSMRLSPVDPTLYHLQVGIGFAHLLSGRFDDASSWAEKAFCEDPNCLPASAVMAASHALAGRLQEARHAMARLRQIYPALRASNLKNWFPIRRPEHFSIWIEGLRKAELPE